MTTTLNSTNFKFPGQKGFYKGKVRDVYNINNELLVMIVTDRISAFDVVLPKGIPYKGQVLNQIACKFLDATAGIVPNWKIATPDPMVTIGFYVEPIKVEMVIRAYLTGHVWRLYKSGKRFICGVPLPEGMREHEKFPHPIITPSTKASQGHDMDISKDEIIGTGLVSPTDYAQLEEYTMELFLKGNEMAGNMGLILVDTKYEFGKKNGKIYLIDEIHSPDSSRYFYAEGYKEKLEKGEQQRQLSKEFVREWLIKNNFQGKEGQNIPYMSDEFVNQISDRYIELYEKITGEKFMRLDLVNLSNRIEQNIISYLNDYF